MTDEQAFQRVFGEGGHARPSFVERVTAKEPTGARADPRAGMATEAAMQALAADEYRAFGFLPAGNVNLSCEVRWWMEATTVPEGLAFPYRLLMEVGFSGDDTLRLLLPDKAIEIIGQRLEPLRQALMRQQVTFIQQWTPLIWNGKPAHKSIIMGIRIAR